MYALFSKAKERKNFSISRQTVHNILKDTHRILPNINRKKLIPKTLYIMADEKYIHLQKSNKESAMLKHLVLFEDIEKKGKQVILKYKLAFTSLAKTFWEEFYDSIVEVYDIDKIEKIFIMGDGANWIKAVFKELSNSSFVLDKFHTYQAIHQTTKNETLKYNLECTILNNDKTTFKDIIAVFKYS